MIEIIIAWIFLILFVLSILGSIIGFIGIIFQEDWGLPTFIFSLAIFGICVIIIILLVLGQMQLWLCEKVPILFKCTA
jgi:hypothetical protein